MFWLFVGIGFLVAGLGVFGFLYVFVRFLMVACPGIFKR